MNPVKWRNDLGAQCVRTHLMVCCGTKGRSRFFLCCLVEPAKRKKKKNRRLFPFEREDQSLMMLQLLISNLNPEILLTLVGVLRA